MSEYNELQEELKTSVDAVNELREDGKLLVEQVNEQGKRIDELNKVVEAAKVLNNLDIGSDFSIPYENLSKALAELDKAVKK